MVLQHCQAQAQKNTSTLVDLFNAIDFTEASALVNSDPARPSATPDLSKKCKQYPLPAVFVKVSNKALKSCLWSHVHFHRDHSVWNHSNANRLRLTGSLEKRKANWTINCFENRGASQLTKILQLMKVKCQMSYHTCGRMSAAHRFSWTVQTQMS